MGGLPGLPGPGPSLKFVYIRARITAAAASRLHLQLQLRATSIKANSFFQHSYPPPNRQTGATQPSIGPDGSALSSPLAFQSGHVAPHAHLPSLARATFEYEASVWRAAAIASLRFPATGGIASTHTPTHRFRCICPRTRFHVRDTRG